MIQLLIAIFGLTAIYMAMGDNTKLRKWAPVVGLAGQPFWFMFAVSADGYGLMVLTIAYTLVYVRAIFIQFRKVGYD